MYNLPLKIKATDKTPLLEYDPKELVFNMIGVSVPDNAKTFYTPIIEWIDGYVKQADKDPLVINIDLDYFSIQSATLLLKIIKLFDKLPKVTLNWYFDDPDTHEIGLDLSSMVTLNFNYIDKNSEFYKKIEK